MAGYAKRTSWWIERKNEARPRAGLRSLSEAVDQSFTKGFMEVRPKSPSTIMKYCPTGRPLRSTGSVLLSFTACARTY